MEFNDITRYGVYLGIHVPPALAEQAAAASVAELAARLGLVNEFGAGGGEPTHAVAFLRRTAVAPGDLPHPGLLAADVVVHAASPRQELLAELVAGLTTLLEPTLPRPVELAGVVRPRRYIGGAMHDFAYARQLVQQPGYAMPNAFLLPLGKSQAWWEKSWMERHTYFLPSYDGSGRMTSEGHALAAEKGVAALMRRFYRHAVEPAPSRRVRLPDLLRVQRRARARVRRGTGEPARRQAEPGVGVRTRGPHLERSSCRDLGRGRWLVGRDVT